MSDITLSQSSPTELDVITIDNELRVDSRLIAEHLGIKHNNFMETLHKYQSELNELGQLPFETEVGYRLQGGGNPQRYALLNEDQAIFAMTLSRNTDQVIRLKLKLTIAFRDARQALQSKAPRRPFFDFEYISLKWKSTFLTANVVNRYFEMGQCVSDSELKILTERVSAVNIAVINLDAATRGDSKLIPLFSDCCPSCGYESKGGAA